MSDRTSAAFERPRFYPPRAGDQSAAERLAARLGRLALLPADWLGTAVDKAWAWAAARWGPGRAQGRAEGPAPAAGAASAETVVAVDGQLACALSVVPGAGHWFAEGPGWRPVLLFIGWAALAVWLSFFAPAAGQRWIFMLVFGFHQWVLLDAWERTLERLDLPRPDAKERFRQSLAAVVLLSLAYGTAGAALRDQGGVVTVASGALAPLFEPGDRLLALRRKRYACGDIVFSRRLQGVERVLAVGGDRVQVVKGRLTVNGAPPCALPISAAILSDSRLSGADVTVPKGSYCVLFPARYYWLNGSDLLARFLVSGRQLDGRVRLRYWPRPEAYR